MSWYWSCNIHGTSGKSEGTGFYCQECATINAKIERAKNHVVEVARFWYGQPKNDEDADFALEAAIDELERLEDSLGVKLQ